MSDSPLISVRGEAVLEVEPEIARFMVHLVSRDTDQRKALDQLTVRNKRALELIKSYGEAVEKLESTGLVVTPVLRDRRRDEKVHRYQGMARISVTVGDFAPLGEMIVRLGDHELTTVAGPWWELRRNSDVYRQARHEAAREAVTRAREYAAALGCRLTGLVALADEGLSTGPAPVARGGIQTMAYSMPAAPGAQPQPQPIDLEPEMQTVRAAVEARFTVTAPDDL